MTTYLTRHPHAALGLTDLEGRPSTAQTLQSRELAALLGCTSHRDATRLVEARLRERSPALASRCTFSEASDMVSVRTRYREDAERVQQLVSALVEERAAVPAPAALPSAPPAASLAARRTRESQQQSRTRARAGRVARPRRAA